MRKLLSVAMFLFVVGISVPAVAALYDIPVTAAGDRVYYWEKGWGWTDTGWINDANPNQVSHYYDYDNRSGSYRDTALSFDLTSFTLPVEAIISATINFNILDIWTSGRNDVGVLNGVGTVYADGGTGWKSFDITDAIKNILTTGGTAADYYFAHTGFSGFTFSSAEGGNPAFIQIATAGAANAAPVPIPAAAWLLGSGLFGLLGLRRKFSK